MADLGPLGTEIIGTTAEGRPIIRNPDGTISTERTATELVNGKFFNFPTIFGGKQRSLEEALAILSMNNNPNNPRSLPNIMIDPETGRATPGFDNLSAALAAATARSRSIR
ncbi:MAG: hypothetical protein QNJ62_05115 [Methyloceanibacter sp.]|nr:hypothetical protein [Methyloceanibacter sp.]